MIRDDNILAGLKPDPDYTSLKAGGQPVALGNRVQLHFDSTQLTESIPLACDTTGIIGLIQMPTLPVVLNFQHPLASFENVLTVLEAIEPKKLATSLPPQVLAGMLLSTLKHYKLLQARPQTAQEQNAILQGAGSKVLARCILNMKSLQTMLKYAPRNQQGQYDLPRYSLDYTTHAFWQISRSLLVYIRRLRTKLDPKLVEDADAQAYIAGSGESSQGIAARRIKFISTVRKDRETIKQAETAAKDLFADIADILDPVLRQQVKVILRSMAFGLSKESTQIVCSKLRDYNNSACTELAVWFERAKFSSLEDVLERFSDSVERPRKTLKEILESKRLEAAGILEVEVAIANPVIEEKLEAEEDFEESFEESEQENENDI